MELIPAVDLLGDDAVRLRQGDFGQVLFRHDPLELVRRFAGGGAELVHVVDLDGARRGGIRPGLVQELVRAAAPARVQASGGIRSLADAFALLSAGAARVVVGTVAFAGPDALAGYVSALRDRLVVALDVRDGTVAIEGWARTGGLDVDSAVDHCVAAGASRLLCTAVDRDGTLGGPDLELIRRVVDRAGMPVLAAGGVRSKVDLAALARIGVEGAVVGRAAAEGRLGRRGGRGRPPLRDSSTESVRPGPARGARRSASRDR